MFQMASETMATDRKIITYDARRRVIFLSMKCANRSSGLRIFLRLTAASLACRQSRPTEEERNEHEHDAVDFGGDDVLREGDLYEHGDHPHRADGATKREENLFTQFG